MNRVLDSLRRFQLAQAAAFRRAGDALGVPDTALITLNVVLGHDDGIAMKELASEVGVSPAVLTSIVDRLEERRWVRRQVSATDRRSTLIIAIAGDDDVVRAVLRALDDPLRKVANAISAETAAVVRQMADAMEEELRGFDPAVVAAP